MNHARSRLWVILFLSLAFSCKGDRHVQYEEIHHEKGQKGGISTRELQKLYKELNLLEKKLSGEDKRFSQDLQDTLKDLEKIPGQLRPLLEKVEDLSEN